VGFRISGGRLVWEPNGERYSAPMNPGLPAAGLVALMDAAGIEKAVLQATLRYNRFFGRVARAHPGRFLPLAMLVDDGDADEATAKLVAAVEDGCAGVYQNPLPGWPGFEAFHTPRFDPVWREVERRTLPVFTTGFATSRFYLDNLPRLKHGRTASPPSTASWSTASRHTCWWTAGRYASPPTFCAWCASTE
jgi:hypothetical protein